VDIYANGRELGEDMEVPNGKGIGQPMTAGSNPAHGTTLCPRTERKYMLSSSSATHEKHDSNERGRLTAMVGSPFT